MTSLNNKKIYHFIFAYLPLWGHTRAPCILAARIAKEHKNIIVTLLLPPIYFKNADAEISAELDGHEAARQRVRLLSLYQGSDSEDFFVHVTSTFQAYPIAYKALLEGNPVTCATTGSVFDGVAAPNAIFLDVYASPLMLATRAITGHSIPIIGFIPVHASFVIHRYGPEHMGGQGDLGAKIEAEAARLGVTVKEIGDTVFYRTEGKINKVPGLPPMYDWEHFPQLLLTTGKIVVSDFLKLAYNGLKECDVAFSLSAYDFEPESIDALKAWFAEEWKKEVYTVGPLLASKPTTSSVAPDIKVTANGNGNGNGDPRSSEIQAFLEKSLKECGEKLLVLISFGSLFWPTVQEYVEEVIEALIEKKFPFIVSHASHFAKITDDLMDRITSSGCGLISKWIPQKFILNHPATGWFITHNGQSGVLESLDNGIPMICWPFEFDQPLAAAHLSTNLHIAFELIEVRTGAHGMQPVLRLNDRAPQGTRAAVGVEIRQVLDACRGERGAELRRNAEAMKTRFGRAWGVGVDGGVARRDFDAFLDKYGINLS